MKPQKTIYLFASTQNLNADISAKDLNFKYKIIGKSKDITQLYNYPQASIDYLIIFANRKRINNMDKRMINYLSQVFNSIVVVGKTKVNVLANYIFIPQSLVSNSLYSILKILERPISSSAYYSYENFYNKASAKLIKVGFNSSHKGFEYIIECAYYIASINLKGNLKTIYAQLANKYKTTISAVERSIRFAISQTKFMDIHAENQLLFANCSNKKFIESINNYIMSHLL